MCAHNRPSFLKHLSVAGSDLLQAKSFPVSHSPLLQAKFAHVNSGSLPLWRFLPMIKGIDFWFKIVLFCIPVTPLWTPNLTLGPLIKTSLMLKYLISSAIGSMMLKPSLWALSIVIIITLKAFDDSHLPINKDSNAPKDILCGFRMPKLSGFKSLLVDHLTPWHRDSKMVDNSQNPYVTIVWVFVKIAPSTLVKYVTKVSICWLGSYEWHSEG